MGEGSGHEMNDERAVEVMAARMRLNDEPVDSRRLAELLLAALRAEGYEIVDRDDLSGLTMLAERLVSEVRYFDDHNASECAIVRAAEHVEAALVRLVPVGGEG